jgi:hypothetical protein
MVVVTYRSKKHGAILPGGYRAVLIQHATGDED